MNVKLQAPSYEGLDLDNKTVQALDSLAKATQAALDKIQDRTPKDLTANITIATPDGKIPLREIGQRIARRGEVRMFYITWAEAFGMRGWLPCTGAKNTPPISPDPALGGEQRFPRGAAFGKDEIIPVDGGTHLHACLFDTEVTDIDSDGVWVDNTLCGSQIEVPDWGHWHPNDADTETTGDGDASALPPHCDLIFMMKT